jgi:mono/diheme cytochrome c family protein
MQGHYDTATGTPAGTVVGEDRRRLRKRLICGVLATRRSLALVALVALVACGACTLRTMAGWGRGRVDVTADGIDNPVSITDLRPVRHQRNLHHAATLRNDPLALAVRIETLTVTSHAELVRPPRKVAAALAVYLLSLAPTTPLPTGDGAVVFARECASCHQGEAASGPPVPLAAVGTDPAVGTSPDRGTGSYRVPSLRAVGDRRRMFASGAIDDLDALLAPDRAVPGHRFGLTLDATDRTALLAYLRGL